MIATDNDGGVAQSLRNVAEARGGVLRWSIAVALVGTLFALWASPAWADTFTVNSVSDPGSGECDVAECTLREAIVAANARTGPDTIAFAIPSSGVRTIAPTSALPTITDPVIINGYSQAGSHPATSSSAATLLIELNGQRAGGANGLNITSADSTVKGLVIDGGFTHGVDVRGLAATGNTIKGNYIGTNVAGNAASPNLRGIVLSADDSGRSSGNTVGGTTVAARNVLSGNTFTGVTIAGANNNLVEGNYLGLDASGSSAVGNGLYGLEIFGGGHDNVVGGTESETRNIISGNSVVGLQIFGEGTVNNRAQGNYIGTDRTGTRDVGNRGPGVSIDAGNNIIGGIGPGAGNVIAYNDADGVHVLDGPMPNVGNRLLSNSIFNNDGLGIDLSTSGVTANDSGDSDSGPNDLQNFPELSSAASSSTGTTVRGTISTTPGATLRLEFYASPAADPSGNGEGKKLLGAKKVTLVEGDAPFVFKTSKITKAGWVVTATATNATGSTSEFSAAVAVQRQ